MHDMILNTNILPDPLFKLIHSPQIRVQETDKGIVLMPLEHNQSFAAIKKARGMYTDGKLTVDRFLAEKRTEEAGRLKATYKMSLADAVVLAETFICGGMVLTADHHELDIVEQNEKISFKWIR